MHTSLHQLISRHAGGRTRRACRKSRLVAPARSSASARSARDTPCCLLSAVCCVLPCATLATRSLPYTRSSKDDLSHVQYARFTFPLPAAGCAPHLAYLSSLSLGGRAYSGLGWRIFSSPCFHPSGAPTIGHSIGIFVVLDTDVSTQ